MRIKLDEDQLHNETRYYARATLDAEDHVLAAKKAIACFKSLPPEIYDELKGDDFCAAMLKVIRHPFAINFREIDQYITDRVASVLAYLEEPEPIDSDDDAF